MSIGGVNKSNLLSYTKKRTHSSNLSLDENQTVKKARILNDKSVSNVEMQPFSFQLPLHEESAQLFNEISNFQASLKNCVQKKDVVIIGYQQIIKELKEKLNSQTQENRILNAKLENAGVNLLKAESSRKLLDNEIIELKRLSNTNEKKLLDAKNENQQLNEKINELSGKNNKLKKEKSDLRQTKQNHHSTIETLQTKFDNLYELNNELQLKMNIAKSNIAVAQLSGLNYLPLNIFDPLALSYLSIPNPMIATHQLLNSGALFQATQQAFADVNYNRPYHIQI